LDINKLVKELNKAAEKMQRDNSTYVVNEVLEPGRGEGNYKLVFHAKKKGGFGFLKAAIEVAKGAMYGDLGWGIRRAADEIIQEKVRYTLEPIKREVKGSEIAPILKRWAETIPQGFIETIGSTLTLPKDPSWISAKINPGKEIRLVIDFAKIRGLEAPQEVSETATIPSKPMIAQTPPSMPVPAVSINIPKEFIAMLPTVIPRVYVTGSLRNFEDGFELKFMNELTDIAITAPIELTVDDRKIDLEKIEVISESGKVLSKNISIEKPFIFRQGDILRLRIHDKQLSASSHTIGVKTTIQGYGEIKFRISDQVR